MTVLQRYTITFRNVNKCMLLQLENVADFVKRKKLLHYKHDCHRKMKKIEYGKRINKQIKMARLNSRINKCA